MKKNHEYKSNEDEIEFSYSFLYDLVYEFFKDVCPFEYSYEDFEYNLEQIISDHDMETINEFILNCFYHNEPNDCLYYF